MFQKGWLVTIRAWRGARGGGGVIEETPIQIHPHRGGGGGCWNPTTDTVFSPLPSNHENPPGRKKNPPCKAERNTRYHPNTHPPYQPVADLMQ